MKSNIIKSLYTVFQTPFLVGLFLFHLLFSQDVMLSFGEIDLEQQSIEINFTSTENVEAFELLISGISLTGGILGVGAQYGFFISTSESGYVLAFGFPGAYIPPSQGLLCTLFFGEKEDLIPCFQTTNFSGTAGIDLSVQDDGCIIIDYPPTIIMGDINLDMQLNILDVVIMVGYVLDNIVFSEMQEFLGDLNGDENIDVIDIVVIIDYILT